MNPDADPYFAEANAWQDELAHLRTLVLACGLTEALKWGVPCYTFRGKNIVLIHVFKDYCALLFFKGALLADTDNLLVQQTKNVQATRQFRFTGLEEIIRQEAVIKTYVYEAIEVETAGLQVALKPTAAYDVPDEFQHELDEEPRLKAAFNALTPGRQRAYLLHFSAPKQAKTRQARVEKYRQHILDGKGLTD